MPAPEAELPIYHKHFRLRLTPGATLAMLRFWYLFMRVIVSVLFLASSLFFPLRPCNAEEHPLILDGVIVARNPAFSIALVRREGASRARPLRVGQEYSGYVLVEVAKSSALFEGDTGALRLYLTADGGVPEFSEASSEVSRSEHADGSEWIQRDFSRSQTKARLEKEIPVILSDTELSPRVEEGEVMGLELLRLPDGTVLSETGLLPGDVLRSINDEPLRGLDSLWKILARHQNGDELRVVVERRGEILRLAYAFTN